MKRTLLYVLAISLFTLQVFAQDPAVKNFSSVALKDLKPLEKDGWNKIGTFITNVNQGALRNWAAGGEENTFGITTILNYNINHKKGKYTWNNYFDLALGFQNSSSFGRFRKVDDRIDITSKYGYQFSKQWYCAFLANLNTQALVGYDYNDSLNRKISNFFSPGKFLISAGIDFRPDTHFSLFLSPITTRWIFKTDKSFYTIDKFGVPAFSRSYNEVGAFATAKYNKAFAPWALYTGRLDLFSNYKRNPQNLDVLFTNLLSMKFNKWLGTTISLDMIYDDQILQRTQVKEIFGLGLTVKL